MLRSKPHSLRLPRAMAVAPPLDPNAIPGPLRRRYALLLNPFYCKDPHASFGKHVLTPTLALTAVAGATPFKELVRLLNANRVTAVPVPVPVPQRKGDPVVVRQDEGMGFFAL